MKLYNNGVKKLIRINLIQYQFNTYIYNAKPNVTMNRIDFLALTTYPGNGRKNSTRGALHSTALVVFYCLLSGLNFKV